MDRADFGTVTSFDLFRVNSGSYKIRVGYTSFIHSYSFIANCQTAVVHKNKTKRMSKIYKSQYILGPLLMATLEIR